MWRAWHALHADRGHTIEGMAAPLGGMMLRSIPGRIPWTAIIRYADWHEYGREQTNILMRLLGDMDKIYLDWWTERMKPT